MRLDNPKLLLRMGLTLVFAYAGIASLIKPTSWIGYFPEIFRTVMSDNTLIISHVIFTLSMAAWLISNKKIFYAAIVATLYFMTITLFNFVQLDIVFRDIGLAFAAASLAALTFDESFSKR